MKKFLALLLVVVMSVFCFTACGDKPEDNENNNGSGSFGNGLYSDSGLPAIPVEPDDLS